MKRGDLFWVNLDPTIGGHQEEDCRSEEGQEGHYQTQCQWRSIGRPNFSISKCCCKLIKKRKNENPM